MKFPALVTLALITVTASTCPSFANPLGWVRRSALACDKFVERGLPHGKCEVTNPTGTSTPIRTLPSATSGRTVATIANDTLVSVLDRSGNWLFIGEFEGSDCKLVADEVGPPEHPALGPLHCQHE